MLFVDDVEKEYQRLKQLGVKFTTAPTKTLGSTIVVFDETRGNYTVNSAGVVRRRPQRVRRIVCRSRNLIFGLRIF